MPDAHPKHAWQIREVEQLISMPRRYIQRACYEGEGGVGLLAPADSTWGHRTYGCEDLATLFVANELRRDGLSLPEIKQEFDKAAGQGINSLTMLAIWVHRLREQEEELRGRLFKAEVLLTELGAVDPEQDGTETLITARVASCMSAVLSMEYVQKAQQATMAFLRESRTCQERGDAPGSGNAQAAAATYEQACAHLADDKQAAHTLITNLLGDPGMDLALEIWLGQGIHTYIEQAWSEHTKGMDSHKGA